MSRLASLFCSRARGRASTRLIRAAPKLALLSFLGLGLAIGCNKAPPAPPPAAQPDWYPKEPPPLLSAQETTAYRQCSADDDCVYAQNGCCDCANGGEEIAVNKGKLKELQARFACAGVACTERGRRPACGVGTASCRAGLCEFQAAAE